LYEEMQLTDSIPRWRAQGFVLLPAGHPMGAHTPDGEIGGWVYFQKIAAEEGKRGSAEEGKRGRGEEGKRGERVNRLRG
ncbi:MAG: hypothetical protein JXA28_03095, partial [Bacteroidetes bacterium]|nr:hypothetical protein [Bacteroidota bacterium]